ncbi:TetR/AcrR family transcriptional regulator [Acidimangrovimonas pyrenivorans]|uniref:TetR/AcrR family transcriptional regulator n=1 Tax=Acidimangrovimonas pyrenivorans TaxID=2030798 RepID=A0ABV7ANA8_9RHOB
MADDRGAGRAGPPPEGRVARRQRRNREALIRAARLEMMEKGLDAATMLEIAERADVGAGTVYNYFKSKEELALAAMEDVMRDLSLRIKTVTDSFDDPARVYAFGLRNLLETASGDSRWRQLLSRTEVIADAIYRQTGPYAIADLEAAKAAGCFDFADAALLWRLSTHAIVGVSLAITHGDLARSVVDETVIRLLCMAGVDVPTATELARRPCPPLPPEEVG